MIKIYHVIVQYWFKNGFGKKHETIDKTGLYLSDYTFVDKYQEDIDDLKWLMNFCYINVFDKCVDGKYYYIYRQNIPTNYYNRIIAFN